MRSKHFFGVLVVGGSLVAAMSAGCGSSSNSGTGGTSTSTTSKASSTASSSSSKASTTTTSTGGTGGSGTGGSGGGAGGMAAHDCSTAMTVKADTFVPCPADPSGMTQCTAGANIVDAMTPDFYKFTGKKGDQVNISTLAASLNSSDPQNNNATVVDTVVTLVSASDPNTPIAADDDAWPRVSTDSSLYVTLPADGDYCIRIEDCNSWVSNLSVTAGCADPTMITTWSYGFTLVNVPNLTTAVNGGAPMTPPTPVVVTPVMNPNSMTTDYFFSTLYGNMPGETDTYEFEFDVPSDITTMDGVRPRLYLWPQPSGSLNGDGSTTSPGEIWVSDSADPTATRIASFDDTNYGDGDLLQNPMSGAAEMWVPITPGNTYYVFVRHPMTAPGANDYYNLEAYAGLFYVNPVEGMETHDTLATAEPLTAQPTNADGSTSYFIDGDLTAPGTTPSYFEFDIPSGAMAFQASCSAERIGSGLRNFTFEVHDATDTLIPGATITEDPTIDQSIMPTTIPAGATKLYLKVSADDMPDPNVSGRFYNCGVTVK